MELINEALRQSQRVLPRLRRPGDDLVVDVREVTHVLHVVPQVAQQAVQDVEGDVYARVACRGVEGEEVLARDLDKWRCEQWDVMCQQWDGMCQQ